MRAARESSPGRAGAPPQASDAWAAGPARERDDAPLFELEMLLSGLVALGGVHPLPGRPSVRPSVAEDFAPHLRIARDASYRVVQLSRALLGDAEPREAEVGGSAPRGGLSSEPPRRSPELAPTPEQSLGRVRVAFGQFLDLADGLLRAGRASHRVWAAFHGVVAREIEATPHVFPVGLLSFRAELDRIDDEDVLDLLSGARSQSAHGVLAQVFLALFRLLRAARLVERQAADGFARRRSFVVLAAFRGDVLALTEYLTRDAADALAEGLQRALFAVPARRLASEQAALRAEAQALVALRCVFVSVAGGLALEVRRIFERELPAPEAADGEDALGPQLVAGARALAEAVRHAIRGIAVALGPDRPLPERARSPGEERAASERMRRDVWIFQQVLRAFLALAEGHRAFDRDGWDAPGGLQFVRDFLAHVRVLGHAPLRTLGYPGLSTYLDALDDLRDVDLLEPDRLARAVDESRRCAAFLTTAFDEIGARPELSGVPFDRVAAADLLKLHLGRA